MSTRTPPVVPSPGLSSTRCQTRPRLRPAGPARTGPSPTGLAPARLRANCRLALPPQVWARLCRLAGPTVEWWADRNPGSVTGYPHAAMLGRRGLAVADPIGFDPAALAYTLTCYRLAEAVSHDITHRPEPDTAPEPMRYAPFIGLVPTHQELLAQLPTQAGYLLQRPFVDASVHRCQWHFEDVGEACRMFMVHLADAERVTVAYGVRTVPPGHTPATAHWALRVCIAAVADRDTAMIAFR